MNESENNHPTSSAHTASTYISWILKGTLSLVVLAFEATQSLNFFDFLFPPEKWFEAYLGFGLTNVATLVYLWLFLKDADTELKKTVCMIMMLIGVLGGIATAGFGMSVEAYSRSGFSFTESDISFMILAIRILLLLHGLALLFYFAGDKIISTLGPESASRFVATSISVQDRNNDRRNDNQAKNQQSRPDLARQFNSEDLLLILEEVKRREKGSEKDRPENPTQAGKR